MRGLGIRNSACCALALALALVLAGCGMPPVPSVSGSRETPVVVRADAKDVPAPAEAFILAHRILQRDSDDLLLDARRRRALAVEIERVLSRIRDADPSAADVTVRPFHALGRLILDPEPDLLESLSGLLNVTAEPVALRTGRDEFDALNARLGLSAVTLLPALGTAVFHVDEHVNIVAAVEAYAAMDGVGYAGQDSHLGDGPDIDASKTSGTWHVIIRQAWGDCPAGCLHQQLSFFTVTDTDVERIEPARAMVVVEFATLLDNRGWR